MCWISNRHKGFMVNNYYSLLVGSNNCFFPWKSIWKRKIPSRVVFFCLDCCFRGMHGECMTIANLRKRKVWILGWCYFRKCNGESVDHLFLHCKNCCVTIRYMQLYRTRIHASAS